MKDVDESELNRLDRAKSSSQARGSGASAGTAKKSGTVRWNAGNEERLWQGTRSQSQCDRKRG